MKKKVWTVTPFFILYTVGITALAAFSFRWNIYVFVTEMLTALLSIVLVFVGIRRFNRHISKTIQKAVESYRITPEHKDHLKTLRIKAPKRG